ncbi:hypothetical protein CCP3SC15_480009 [Gammaproteobacteria bacterium]
MTFARLTAVYGLSFGEIRYGMPLAAIKAYIERIPQVLAERKIIAGSGAAVPFMADPEKTMEMWSETAYGENVARVIATPGMLKMIGIGVEHVGPKPQPG